MPEVFHNSRLARVLGRAVRATETVGACTVLLTAIAVVALGAAAPESTPRTTPPGATRAAEVATVAVSPTIDGRLAEPAWDRATTLSAFVDLETGEPAAPKTHVRVARDRRWLYVAAVCETEDAGRLVAERTRRNSDVFYDDSIELLLDPIETHARVFRFVLNSRGTRMDEVIPFDGRGTGEERPFWLGRAHTGGDAGENRWAAEIAVDLASLGLGKDNSGTWRANFIRHARGATRSDSAWSRARFWKFGCDKSGMGSLTGIETRAIGYGCRLRVIREDVRVAETVLRCRLGVEVANAWNDRLVYDVILRTTTRWLETRQIAVGGRQAETVDFRFEMARGEEAEVKVEARMGGTKMPVAAIARVLTVPPPVQGWFDRSYYSREAAAAFQVEIGLPPAEKRSLQLRLFGADTGELVWEKSPSLRSARGGLRSRAAALIPLEGVPVGGYLMETILEDAAQGKRFRVWDSMRRLQPREGEIQVDAAGFFRRDGAPFYPIEVRRVDRPGHLVRDEIKARSGFNVNWGWYIYGDAAPSVYVRNLYNGTGCLGDINVNQIFWAGGPARDRFIARVRELGRLPFMFAYGLESLPGHDAYSTEATATTYRYIQTLAPHGVFYPLLGSPYQAGRFADCADFLMIPCRAVATGGVAEPEWVYEQVRCARRGAGPHVPIVASFPAYRDDEKQTERPTAPQMGAMTYLAMIAGAAGLVFDGYHYPVADDPEKRGFSYDRRLREIIYLLSRHVAYLAPILLAPEATDAVAVERTPYSPVRWTARRHGGMLYIIAANCADRKAYAAFGAGADSPGFAEAREVFEERAIELDGSRFSVEFEPYAAHVFRVTESR